MPRHLHRIIGFLGAFWLLFAVQTVRSADPAFRPELQAELDRRQQLLQGLLQDENSQRKLDSAESVRKLEQKLILAPLPDAIHAQLVDEHVGLLSWMSEQYDLDFPQKAVSVWEEAIPARRDRYGEKSWQVAAAKAELHRAKLIAALNPQQHAKLEYARNLADQAIRSKQQGDLAAVEKLQQQTLDIQMEVLGSDVHSTALAMHVLGRTLLERGQPQAAQPILAQAVRISRNTVGPHPPLVGVLGDLAVAVHEGGDARQAAQLQLETAKLSKEVFGEQHQQYGVAISNLALFVAETGEVTEALRLSQEANRIFAQQENPEESLGDNWNIQGTLFMRMRKYDLALDAYRKAIDFQVKAHGKLHSNVSVACGNAAMPAIKLRRLPEAEQYMSRSLAILDQTTGRRNPAAAERLIQLATLRREEGRMKDVEQLLRDSCRLLQESVGENHPRYAAAANQWAVVLAEQGQKSQAEDLLLQAARVQAARLGPDSLELAATLTNLARVQASRNQSELTKQALDAAGKICLEALQRNRIEYADHLRQAAAIYEQIDESGLAKSALSQAVDLLETELGLDDPEVACATGELGLLLVKSGEQQRGAALVNLEQEILVRQLGKTHPQALEAAYRAAHVQRLMGNPKQAVSQLVDIEQLVKKQFGPKHEIYGDLLIELGRSFLLEHDAQRAEPSLQAAVNLFLDQLGQDSPKTKEAQQLLELASTNNVAAITPEKLRRLERHTDPPQSPIAQASLKDDQVRAQRIAELISRLANATDPSSLPR